MVNLCRNNALLRCTKEGNYHRMEYMFDFCATKVLQNSGKTKRKGKRESRGTKIY